MALTPLTLAALATSAVSELEPVATRPHHPAGVNYRSAILTTADDELLMSVPLNAAAEVRQSAHLLALTALTEGARAQLPFAVPQVLGITRAGNTRAVVTTWIPGGEISAEDLEADALLIDPIATVTAAIHELPRAVVQQGGLPVRTAQDLRLAATRVIDRANATRLLPDTIHRRWLEVTELAELWDFAPVTSHGALGDASLLVLDDEIIGVLEWGQLSVGDPAADLAWLHRAQSGVFDAVLKRYLEHTDTSDAETLRVRARLYHELEIAHRLLHGFETHDQAIVADAVAHLDDFVDQLSILAPAAPVHTPLDEPQVEALLAETPLAPVGRSDTAAFEALDEDRMFGHDTDFIEPLSDDGRAAQDDSSAADTNTDTDAPDTDSAAAEISEQETEAYDEFVTEPIADEDLPPQRYS